MILLNFNGIDLPLYDCLDSYIFFEENRIDFNSIAILEEGQYPIKLAKIYNSEKDGYRFLEE